MNIFVGVNKKCKHANKILHLSMKRLNPSTYTPQVYLKAELARPGFIQSSPTIQTLSFKHSTVSSLPFGFVPKPAVVHPARHAGSSTGTALPVLSLLFCPCYIQQTHGSSVEQMRSPLNSRSFTQNTRSVMTRPFHK